MLDNLVGAIGTGIAQGAMIALVALGYSMVYGILKLINFAHSEVFMMGAFAGFFMISFLGAESSPIVSGVFGTLAAMAMAGALGALVERLAYAPLRARMGESRIAPLVTALGMSVLLTNLAQLLFSAKYRSYPQIIPLGQTRLIIVITAFVTMIALQVLVHRTWFGKSMRALSMNEDAARLMGVRTGRVISLTFMTGSALAALGAVLFCLDQSQAYPMMGTVIGTRAFVAAVIGGIGSIPGAMLGGLFIGLLGEMTKLTPYSSLQDVFIFIALVAVLLVKPSGLMGKVGVEKV